MNAEIAAFSACLTWAVEADLLNENPLGQMKPLPQLEADPRKRLRALTDIYIAKILSAAAEMDRDYEYGQAVIWRTIMESGVRWSEAARLRASDVVRNVLRVPRLNDQVEEVAADPALAENGQRVGSRCRGANTCYSGRSAATGPTSVRQGRAVSTPMCG